MAASHRTTTFSLSGSVSRRPFRTVGRSAAAVMGAAGLTVGLGLAGFAAALPVPEGDAASFAILASSTVTNTNQSTVVGDIGVAPGDEITGYDDGADAIEHEGELHLADTEATSAQVSARDAYVSADAQDVDETFPTAELSGMTLTGGVYDSLPGDFANSGTLTLDAEGDPSTVFIFQMESTLVTSSGSSVELINGANSCNVYWVVGSSATLGSNSTTVGTIMADQSVTMNSGATLDGRAWALEAAVTLDNNVINSNCVIGETVVAPEPEPEPEPEEPTAPQVPTPPTGGVPTGDGSSLGGSPVSLTLVAGMALALVAMTTFAAFVRERRTAKVSDHGVRRD